MEKKGAFIVIEGLDGSGKTTQAKIIALKLQQRHKTLLTFEPSKGKIGKLIRNQFLYGEKRPCISIEALLFAADRIEHVENVIKPALVRKEIVISDRYYYSSLAYQGSAGLDLEWIKTINQKALKPDLALFIDVDPEVTLCRLKRKKSIMENLETQKEVREIYLEFVDSGELKRVDGNGPKKLVAQEVLKRVLELFNDS
jgi:dTMP kinase